MAQPRRLGAALRLARRYATGGQKPMRGLYLTVAERDDFCKLARLSRRNGRPLVLARCRC